jgi:hypothetical protein
MDEKPRQPADEGARPTVVEEEEYPYYRPRPARQVWLIICVVFIAVGISVLAVYQQGHDKPVLSKKLILPPQPSQPSMAAGPGAPNLGAWNCPSGGGACPGAGGGACPGAGGGGCPAAGGGACPGAGGGGCPAAGGGACPGAGGGGAGGGQRTPTSGVTLAGCPGGCPAGAGGGATTQLVAFGSQETSPRPPAAQPATCPRCGSQALPLCDRCNAIMLPLSNGLFYCPHCGTVGTPLCPYCNARMGSGTAQPSLVPSFPPMAVQPSRPLSAAPPVGGQFLCPTCNTTGLPNWTASGTPVCPSCGALMSLRGAGP